MGKSKGIPKMTPRPAQTINTEEESERVKSMLPKKSMSQLGMQMANKPKMKLKKAKTFKTGGASERVQPSTPQMSMAQIGKSMSKSGPRKNLRETAAAVKGKLQNAYNKATGRNTTADKKKVVKGTFMLMQKSSDDGSRKSIETYDKNGDLKRQRIVDRDASGKKVQVIKRKG